MAAKKKKKSVKEAPAPITPPVPDPTKEFTIRRFLDDTSLQAICVSIHKLSQEHWVDIMISDNYKCITLTDENSDAKTIAKMEAIITTLNEAIAHIKGDM